MDDAPADEDLLRPSELISAVRLMKQAIRLDKLNQFRVNPVSVCCPCLSAIIRSSDADTISFSSIKVYVYSFCGYQARILETYYDSGTLFVGKTAYVDFKEENRGNIKLYLRWMMSEPSGNTTFASANGLEDGSDGNRNTDSTGKGSDDGSGGKRDTDSSATTSLEE